ncbi:MAG TPA: hypothetical protein VIJ31_11210 [Acidothermaceae bacterium]
MATVAVLIVSGLPVRRLPVFVSPPGLGDPAALLAATGALALPLGAGAELVVVPAAGLELVAALFFLLLLQAASASATMAAPAAI